MVDVYITSFDLSEYPLSIEEFIENNLNYNIIKASLPALPKIGERIAVNDRIAEIIKHGYEYDDLMVREDRFFKKLNYVHTIFYAEDVPLPIIHISYDRNLLKVVISADDNSGGVYHLKTIPRIGDKLDLPKLSSSYVTEIQYTGEDFTFITTNRQKPVLPAVIQNKNLEVTVSNDIGVKVKNNVGVTVQNNVIPVDVLNNAIAVVSYHPLDVTVNNNELMVWIKNSILKTERPDYE